MEELEELWKELTEEQKIILIARLKTEYRQVPSAVAPE